MSKTIETRVRRKLARAGFRLLKDRARVPSAHHQGLYQVVTGGGAYGLIHIGEDFTATIDACEAFADRELGRGQQP